MSPMLDIPNRARELGRIRMGEQVPKSGGGRRPSKLVTWRLTCATADYLEAAAAIYGGTVAPWPEAPTEGDQWQLTTAVDSLDVMVPPSDLADALSQWWEKWTGGGCDRRCNGEVETLGGARCQCPADLAERLELAKTGKACKPTTRAAFILPKLPDLGVWRLEAHGMNAAIELPGSIAMLRRFSVGDVWIPGRLRLDQRTSKKDGQTHHYGVPVVELPSVTVAELMGPAPGAVGPPRAELAAGSSAAGGGATPAAPEATATTRSGDSAPASRPSKPASPPQSAPPAQTGADAAADGPRPFLRISRTRAKRLWPDVDDAAREGYLDGIVTEVTEGRVERFADVTEPGDANAVLAELGRIAEKAGAAS